jgi:hypothetical protein
LPALSVSTRNRERVAFDEREARSHGECHRGWKVAGECYGYQLVDQWYVKKNETKKVPKFNLLSTEKIMREVGG